MAGKFEISKNADGTFTFDLKIDDIYGKLHLLFLTRKMNVSAELKAVKKNSRMKVPEYDCRG